MTNGNLSAALKLLAECSGILKLEVAAQDAVERRKTVRTKHAVQQTKYAIKEPQTPCVQCDIGLLNGDRFCSRCGKAL